METYYVPDIVLVIDTHSANINHQNNSDEENKA